VIFRVRASASVQMCVNCSGVGPNTVLGSKDASVTKTKVCPVEQHFRLGNRPTVDRWLIMREHQVVLGSERCQCGFKGRPRTSTCKTALR
jgi:hypothetical protein